MPRGFDPTRAERISKPPSWSDILNMSEIERQNIPLKNKRHGRADLDIISRYARLNPEVERFWNEAKVWLTDPTLYKRAQNAWHGRIFAARLTNLEQDLNSLLTETHKIEIADKLHAKGTVSLFDNVEMRETLVRRAICNTVTINRALGRETVMEMKNHTRAELRETTRQRRFCVHLDISACYDSYEPVDEIKNFLFFQSAGKYYRFKVLPTGQRQAVQVAYGAIHALTTNLHPMVTVETLIDNVRISGDTEGDVRTACAEFVRRTWEAGFIINDIDEGKETPEQAAERILAEEGDFLGEHYRYFDNTVCSTQKTVKKMESLWAQRAGWTNRKFASFMGLLFYASDTMGIRLAKYYHTRTLYSFLAKNMSVDDRGWDFKFVLLKHIEEELREWSALLIKNVPRTIEPQRGARYIIIVDASSHGYGYILLDRECGKVVHAEGRLWPTETPEWLSKYSARSEPLAVVLAVGNLEGHIKGETFDIMTDHKAFMFCHRRGYSKGFLSNECLKYLEETSPNFNRAWFIPGEHNPADPLSRRPDLAIQLDVNYMMKTAERAMECCTRSCAWGEGV